MRVCNVFLGRHKTDGTRKHLRSSDEKHVRDDESTSEHSGGNSSHAKRKTLSLKTNESDSNSNVAISDDSTGQAANGAVSPTAHRKTVAIDMSQNECFTHRLLPAVSLEFDNVMDQVVYLHNICTYWYRYCKARNIGGHYI